MHDDKTRTSHEPPPQLRPDHSARIKTAEVDGQFTVPQIPDYELVKVIGRGSYGEVWLARNVMGAYRAVKVVHRASFEHQRPYDREFDGIKSYEPVSRRHESQVAVLHVGRHLEDAYFYYIMELADDAAPESESESESEPKPKPTSEPHSHPSAVDPDEYQPKTLQTELRRRGRLPLVDCIALGLSMATALRHLHESRLIHRDIKPGNVIFVNGTAKLADIGLVAEQDTTMSFVGTSGYIPPEGPGTVQADIYSLGKVLYEISTGKDRNEFPELPSDVEDLTQENLMLEFNEILLKAAHGDPRKRYSSASELAEDLSLLQHGKSVRSKLSRQFWIATAQRFALAASLVFLIGTAGYLVARNPGGRSSIIPRQFIVNGGDLPNIFMFPGQFDFSPEGNRILFANEQTLSIWDERTSLRRELNVAGIEGLTLPVRGLIRWAPDGERFLFLANRRVGGSGDAEVFTSALFQADTRSLQATQLTVDVPYDERPVGAAWHPAGDSFTVIEKSKSLFTQRLDGTREAWENTQFLGRRSVLLGAYSPDGAWLAFTTDAGSKDAADDRDIWIMPHMGGRAIPVIAGFGSCHFPTWDPDGRTLFFVSDGGIPNNPTRGLYKISIDPESGSPVGDIEAVLIKNGQRIIGPKFVDHGKRLVYAVVQSNSQIWAHRAGEGEPFPLIRGDDPVPSPDGRTVYFTGQTPEQHGIFAVDLPGEGVPRKIAETVPLSHGLTRGSFSLSNDGSSLAVFGLHDRAIGVFVVPTIGGKPRMIEATPAEDVILPVWSPDGNWIAFTVDKDLIRVSPDGKVRERLATLYRWHGWSVRWSPDGSHLAALAYAEPEEWEDETGVFVVNVEDRAIRKLTPDSEDKYKEGLEWHPDGDRLNYFFYGPEKWSAKIKWAYLDGRDTEEMIDQADHWDYLGVWSPDGKQFVFSSDACADGGGIHRFDLDSGEITHSIRRGWLPSWSRDGTTSVWVVNNTLSFF